MSTAEEEGDSRRYTTRVRWKQSRKSLNTGVSLSSDKESQEKKNRDVCVGRPGFSFNGHDWRKVIGSFARALSMMIYKSNISSCPIGTDMSMNFSVCHPFV